MESIFARTVEVIVNECGLGCFGSLTSFTAFASWEEVSVVCHVLKQSFLVQLLGRTVQSKSVHHAEHHRTWFASLSTSTCTSTDASSPTLVHALLCSAQTSSATHSSTPIRRNVKSSFSSSIASLRKGAQGLDWQSHNKLSLGRALQRSHESRSCVCRFFGRCLQPSDALRLVLLCSTTLGPTSHREAFSFRCLAL